LFGERGKDGVVAATTKEFHSRHREMKDTPGNRVKPLLIAVAWKDGAFVCDGWEGGFHGDKEKNGVILIVLKKKSSYVPKMTINGKDGPMSVMADRIRTTQGGEQVVITAEKQPGRQGKSAGMIGWESGDGGAGVWIREGDVAGGGVKKWWR